MNLTRMNSVPNRRISCRHFLLLTVFTVLGSLETLGQAIDTTALYHISNSQQKEKSLVLLYDGTNNLLVLRTTKVPPAQFWKVLKDKDGNYQLVNSHFGNRFSAEVVNDAGRLKLILGATRKVVSQALRITTNPNGTYRITCSWLDTEKALDIAPAIGDVNQVIMNAMSTVESQEWKFTRLPVPKGR